MNPGRSKNEAQGRPPRHDVTPDRRAGVPTPNPSQGQSPTDALRVGPTTPTRCSAPRWRAGGGARPPGLLTKSSFCFHESNRRLLDWLQQIGMFDANRCFHRQRIQ